MDVYEESYPVGFTAVDESGYLSMAAAFDYFQEAAIRHAEALGVGRAPMAEIRQGWVLSRMSVLMEKRPRQEEQITVRTWPRGWEKLFAIRDFDILDRAGIPIVRARSCWLIVDIDKRRPLRPQATMEKLPLNEGRDSLADGGSSLETMEAAGYHPEKLGERRAAYSDIDFNGHMNNARYVQWIQDITDPDALTKAKAMRLDINYLNEIKLGETMEIRTVSVPQGTFIEGRRTGDGQAAFRAKLRLNPAV
ncbi:acyl-[acyl-carrier-protein] thioesterase [Treponema primitia]|uniref:acyl-[acyl-carrier-protein] thioesterase n=1 Tax=Treponema primitia TaxID=88058 RepID=UPI0002555571|nr:acyl-ACP thioesterase domain-containing protein [Treponema primitia]